MEISVDHSFPLDLLTKDDTGYDVPIPLSGCNVCAENHDTEACTIFVNSVHVPDKKVPPRALLTLPDNLKVEKLADGSKSVITNQLLPKGTQFGPYKAKQLYSVNPFDLFPLKVFGDAENILPDYYLDTANEEHCNWMCYIAPAHNLDEQNMICYQIKLEIFFSTIRDILPGEHLKVWYSPFYARKLGVKIFSPKTTTTLLATDLLKESEIIQKVVEKLPANVLGAVDKPNWSCKMCNFVDINVVSFAKHLQKHYLKMMNNSFVCDICDQGFNSRKKLINHKRITHTVFTISDGEEQFEKENFSNRTDAPKTDLLEACMPKDNLINDALTESDLLDNPSLLDQLSLTNVALYNDLNDVDTLRAILCDDNTKASNTAQEKSIADFSLELVENSEAEPKTQENESIYTCDICNKQFKKMQYIHRHLKKHTGEFTCLQCLVVFTRKENYMRHPCCLTDKNIKVFNCSYCSKNFLQKKYLRRHLETHLKKYSCVNCGNKYTTEFERNSHNCVGLSYSQKSSYKCEICNKIFFRELYLKKHIRNCHKNHRTVPVSNEEKTVICEICAEKFKNVASLRQHKLQHRAPRYECEICSKKFFRTNVYTYHLTTHGKPAETCKLCGKKLKNKKTLAVHMGQHNDERKYSCDLCGKHFLQRSNLLKHRVVHYKNDPVNCSTCLESFQNKFYLAEHVKKVHETQNLQDAYKCPICDKIFSKCILLTRHINIHHSDMEYMCHYCSEIFKTRTAVKKHLQEKHLEKKAEWNDPAVISSFLVPPQQKQQQNEDYFIIDNSVNTENVDDVLLSIPETVEPMEQQITLGKNAYILEDGTIVEPQEAGDVMFYVLDQNT